MTASGHPEVLQSGTNRKKQIAKAQHSVAVEAVGLRSGEYGVHAMALGKDLKCCLVCAALR